MDKSVVDQDKSRSMSAVKLSTHLSFTPARVIALEGSVILRYFIAHPHQVTTMAFAVADASCLAPCRPSALVHDFVIQNHYQLSCQVRQPVHSGFRLLILIRDQKEPTGDTFHNRE